MVARKPTTVPEPFSLSCDSRHVDAPVAEERVTFHANPVPKAILEGVVVRTVLTSQIFKSSLHIYSPLFEFGSIGSCQQTNQVIVTGLTTEINC